jgi:hypothetical protein
MRLVGILVQDYGRRAGVHHEDGDERLRASPGRLLRHRIIGLRRLRAPVNKHGNEVDVLVLFASAPSQRAQQPAGPAAPPAAEARRSWLLRIRIRSGEERSGLRQVEESVIGRQLVEIAWRRGKRV